MITADPQIERIQQTARALSGELRTSLEALDRLERSGSTADEVVFLRTALRVRDLASSYAADAARRRSR